MNRKSAKRSSPDPLTLERHLEQCTVPELDGFLRYWSPHEKRRNGRAALVEKLLRIMSDENVIYGKVDLLSERVRAVLLALLRQTHYTSDLQGLFRGVHGLEMEYYEAEAALTALARRGFVHVSRAHNWLHYGRSAYAIPVEMALVMRGLAGTDRRPLDQVFTHEGFTPSFVEAGAAEDAAPLPASVHAAIADLPHERLAVVATTVIERFGGIVTRHEFAEEFAERNIPWESAPFLQEFGRRGLGTVGHLDLREKAIGVDDDALFLFDEVVERYVEEWRSEPPVHDLVLNVHGDLMSDVRTALAQIKEGPVRVAKEGAVYKSARGKLAEKLQFPDQPLLDRNEVADRVLDVARRLALAEPNEDGVLVLTAKGETWSERPLREKVQEAYSLVLADGMQTLRSHHLRRVQEYLVDLLTGEEGRGTWWPGASLAMVARNRYLLALAAEDGEPNRAQLTILHSALTELGRAAQDLLLHDLFSLGLVEVALHEGRAVGVRLSALGQRVLLREAPDAAVRPLVVNPDFEMLVLPEGDVDDLLHELDRIAVRIRTGEVVHFRLDREKVEHATVNGESPDAILARLEANSRSPVPQNVAYSIRSWASRVRSATLAQGLLFRANDPTVIDAIASHPLLRECVAEVIDPTTVFFNDKVSERQIAQELRSLGVYVR